MYLHRLKVNGFKRLIEIDVTLNDATFLIGQNNSGKSSLLKAIEYLLSNKQIPVTDFFSEKDPESFESVRAVDKVVMEAEFRDVSCNADSWRGFKGRTFSYEVENNSDETGISITYKKEWEPGKPPVQFLKSYDRVLKKDYANLSKVEDLIDAGISEDLVTEAFEKSKGNITAASRNRLDYIDEIWDIDDTTEVFFKNPGGIPGNVLSKLPRYLLIPADAGEHELSKANGTLQRTLKELFKEVRDRSENYTQAQSFLNSLATELDPLDEASDFGQMLTDLNSVMSTVFPESAIHVKANLSNPDDVLVPSFDIEMESNIRTSVENQGTGMIRSTAFSLLRFRKKWEEQRIEQNERGLIICFEEPEIFLHPSAANQMRSTIYDLVSRNSQIVASTHSPYMIDLSRRPRQNLVRFSKSANRSTTRSFSVSKAFNDLMHDDKSYVKMILKLDDYVARAFFGSRTILVEGDSEDIVIRETTRRLPKDTRDQVLSNCEIIKGRGKPVLKSLITYLRAVGVEPIVMHDGDFNTPGSVVHNEPIRNALGNDHNLFILDSCLEDILGYESPASEKPFHAYRETLEWGESYEDVPQTWRKIYSGLVGIN